MSVAAVKKRLQPCCDSNREAKTLISTLGKGRQSVKSEGRRGSPLLKIMKAWRRAMAWSASVAKKEGEGAKPMAPSGRQQPASTVKNLHTKLWAVGRRACLMFQALSWWAVVAENASGRQL